MEKRSDSSPHCLHRAAVLFHEVQHPWEMAQSTASSEDALLLLYRRIGTPAGLSVDRFETVEAILAGREVWRELRESGREAR